MAACVSLFNLSLSIKAEKCPKAPGTRGHTSQHNQMLMCCCSGELRAWNFPSGPGILWNSCVSLHLHLSSSPQGLDPVVFGVGKGVKALAGHTHVAFLPIILSPECHRACHPRFCWGVTSHSSYPALSFLWASKPSGFALRVKRLQGRNIKDGHQQEGSWLF